MRVTVGFGLAAVLAAAAPAARAQMCGNGIVDIDFGEHCDEGPANGTASSCCASTCQFKPSGTLCRPLAGVCDLAETCSGASPVCPVDVKSTAQCRASAGACDPAEHCSGISNTCPADARAPSGTTCRAAASACDIAEVCNGVATTCPADVKKPNGTPCPDGLFCDGNESCQAGVCQAGTNPCPMFCSEALNSCLASGCPSGPIAGCLTAEKSLILIKNKEPDDGKDKLIWKWIKGESVSQLQLADPQDTANYALCVYSPTLVVQMDVLPSPSTWMPLSTKGYKFFDATRAQGGANKINLKGSDNDKSKALVVAGGANLSDPLNGGALVGPTTAQLINHSTGACFEASYPTFSKSSTSLFKAKSPP